MNEDAYNSVVADMRLPSGELFGLPVVMDTADESLAVGDRCLLTYQGASLAVFTVESKWRPNKPLEAKNCYGTTSIEHPAVAMITTERGRFYMGGKVEGLALPERVFPCATPAQVRATLPEGVAVLAFQCRNPIHRAHYELFIRALDAPNAGAGAVCLVHPTCGPTQDDDIPGIVRYQTYEVLAKEVDNPRLRWAYLPYSMHMAGPREAIQHMLIRKNYGCTHFIIGRDMAGCKSSLTGDDFYGAYDAQETATKHAPELGMQTVPSLNITYTEEKVRPRSPWGLDLLFPTLCWRCSGGGAGGRRAAARRAVLPGPSLAFLNECTQRASRLRLPARSFTPTPRPPFPVPLPPQGYVTFDVAEREGLSKKNLSGTKFRQMLRGGDDIPEWFAFKSVVQVLRDELNLQSDSE